MLGLQEAQNSEEVEVNYSILFDEYGGQLILTASVTSVHGPLYSRTGSS